MKFPRLLLLFILFQILPPNPAFGGDAMYRPVDMWPKLTQPWSFYFPVAVAVDGKDNIYVLDRMHDIVEMDKSGKVLGTLDLKSKTTTPAGLTIDIQGNFYGIFPDSSEIIKYAPNGDILTQWGKAGSGDGEFRFRAHTASGMAADPTGNIYVVDSQNDRIQKFGNDGKFVAKWGSKGNGDGQLESPNGIAIDGAGNIYVVDSGNNRVEKFGPDFQFLAKWGQEGTKEGEFTSPSRLTVDGTNNIYVVDVGKSRKKEQDRIQKFDANGKFLMAWGEADNAKPARFNNISGIAVDSAANLYTTEIYGFCVQRFNAQGDFADYWSAGSMEGNNLHWPYGGAMDSAGNIYLTDSGSGRVLIYDAKGNFLSKWADKGWGFPVGIAISDAGFAYVQSFGNYITKCDLKGNILSKWGKPGDGPGEFKFGNGGWLAADKQGNIYAADKENHRIQKFDADGKFILQWGKPGSGDGDFDKPCGIAVDRRNGNVYVAELGNSRIQKFDKDGTFLCKWGVKGTGQGEFHQADGFLALKVDKTGNVFVADKGNNRIQKFDENGKFLCMWGEFGDKEGQFGSPTDVLIDASGAVYVLDSLNSRIQKFVLK